MSVLLNESLDLRSGWRVATYVAVFVLMLYATGAALSVVVPGGAESELGFLALNAVALAVPGVAALAFMLRLVDRVPALTFGVGFHEGWSRDFASGLALASLMIGALMGMSLLAGGLRVAAASGGTSAPGLAGVALVLLVSAANEELIFRGYPFQVLMAAIGTWPAMIVMSAIFGLGHHLNPNATWLGTANTFVAGILLCLAYVRTRSLWFPYGIHIGWNLGLGPIFGFPLSGIELSSVWKAETGGAGWITGGAYGPEAGLVVTGVMIAAAAAAARTRRVTVSASLDSLLREHSTKVHRIDTSSTGG